MSGLQFVFSNGIESPFIETKGVTGYAQKSVQILTKKPIRYVSVKIYAGVWVDGIRFYDEDLKLITNQTWHANFVEESTWRGYFEVPEG